MTKQVFSGTYRRLRVYRSAYEAALHIFDLSKAWPKEERYALTDQIRRSSRSVCSNIGEAWFKRRYPKHFVSKLSDAGSEATETVIWLDFAGDCGYITDQERLELQNTYDVIIGGLVKMMHQPEKWCRPPSHVREKHTGYDY